MAGKICLTVLSVLLLSVASHAFNVDFGGLITGQYADHRDENATFAATAARLKAKVEVTDKITGVAQFDFAKEPELLDAFVDYSHSKLLTARLGQFKLPFGFETQISRFDLEAMNRSLVIGHLWNNGVTRSYVRDAGLMLMGRYKIIEYKVGAVNGVGYNYAPPLFCQIEHSHPGRWGDNNNTKDIVGRVGIGVPMFAGLGFSFYEGAWPTNEYGLDPCDTDAGLICNADRTAKAFDLYLDTGKVLVQYEHVWAQGRVTNYASFTDAEYGGYYVVVGYRVTPLIEPVYKVDIFDPDKDADGDRQTDMYFGVNINFQRSARVQLFYRESKLAKRYSDGAFMVQASASF
jgi:hypothetical protein